MSGSCVLVLALCWGLSLTAVSARREEDGLQLIRDVLKGQPFIASASPPNKPTRVSLGAYVNNIYTIDEQNMELSMSWYLRMAWQDERLQFTSMDGVRTIKLPDYYWDKVWTPDIFLRNEKRANAESIITPHRLLRVNGTGHVWYVVRMSTTLTCPMKLQKFPFDTQSCPVMFESFGYTMDSVFFKWLSSPVEVDKDQHLPKFSLTDTILIDCSQNYTGGAFPCLEIRLVLQRNVGYHIQQVFIPSMILVIVSWLQFWLSPGEMTGRVLVGLFSTFTLVAQMVGVRAGMPNVSYYTSLDVWMISCLFFVFATLVLLALVHRLQRKSGEPSRAALRVDIAARVVFPVLYLIFNIIFWCIYTSPV